MYDFEHLLLLRRGWLCELRMEAPRVPLIQQFNVEQVLVGGNIYLQKK